MENSQLWSTLSWAASLAQTLLEQISTEVPAKWDYLFIKAGQKHQAICHGLFALQA